MEANRKRRLSFADTAPPTGWTPDAPTQAKVAQILSDTLSRAIEQGQEHIKRLNTKAADEAVRKVQKAQEDFTRPDHLRLLDELSKMGISSNRPVEVILRAVERRMPVLSATMKQFQREWKAYVRVLHKYNHDKFDKHKAESGPGFFESKISKFTFDRLFLNPLWIAPMEDDFDKDKEFPMLVDDSVFHAQQQTERKQQLDHLRGLPECSGQKYHEEKKQQELLAPVPRADLTKYAEILAAQEDATARSQVFAKAVSAVIEPLIRGVEHSAAMMENGLSALEVHENLPVIDAVGTLESLCTEMRTAWQQNLASQESQSIDHADVEQFLANIQLKVDQLEQESRPTFAGKRYDKQLNAWVHLQTKLARTNLVHKTLTEQRDKTAAVVRRIDHVLRLSKSANATEKKRKITAAPDSEAKEEKKQDTEVNDLARVVSFLHDQRAQFEQYKEMYEKALQEAVDEADVPIANTTLQDALDENRGVLFTAAVHLDFVDWLRAVLTAIGTSFMIAEDREGQLANRVNAAITGSKTATHKHIDTVRENEAKIIDRVRVGLREELQDSKLWVRSQFRAVFATTQRYYQSEAQKMASQVSLERHKQHPQWHKLRLPHETANTILLGLRRELSDLIPHGPEQELTIEIAVSYGLISGAVYDTIKKADTTYVSEHDNLDLETLEHTIDLISTAFMIASYAVS